MCYKHIYIALILYGFKIKCFAIYSLSAKARNTKKMQCSIVNITIKN